MRKEMVFGVLLGALTLAAAPAVTVAGDLAPDFSYYASTGQMYLNTDLLASGSGLYSMLIPGPQANSVVPGRTGLNSGSIQWEGDFWRQDYFNGKEQWINLGVLGANLNTGGSNLLIATYAPGLNLSSFGTVEYGAHVGATDATYYTSVSVVPEPGTLVLLTMAGVAAAFAAVVRRRRMA